MLRHLLRTVNLFDTAKSSLFLGILAACRGQSGADQARGAVYYETYDPRSLDPALSTDVPTGEMVTLLFDGLTQFDADGRLLPGLSDRWTADRKGQRRSEEHTSELQSLAYLVCRLLLEKKKNYRAAMH